MKDTSVKDNVLSFIGDLPAYAYIAYVNVTEVFTKNDYPAWEWFLLKHGWLILLVFRLVIAMYDLTIRLIDREEYIDDFGKTRRKTIWQVVKSFFTEWIR